ncbi:hypothetical protein GGR53DRAFT_467780 [Hypoxylon sp. FL1150]|nr:hypothetical protein GGR53DRAFT_467780 [Hypoxylon sp. FL1150]
MRTSLDLGMQTPELEEETGNPEDLALSESDETGAAPPTPADVGGEVTALQYEYGLVPSDLRSTLVRAAVHSQESLQLLAPPSPHHMSEQPTQPILQTQELQEQGIQTWEAPPPQQPQAGFDPSEAIRVRRPRHHTFRLARPEYGEGQHGRCVTKYLMACLIEAGYANVLSDQILTEESEVAAIRQIFPNDPTLADANDTRKTTIEEDFGECLGRICRFIKQHEGHISLNHVALGTRDAEETAIGRLFDEFWERRVALRDRVDYIRKEYYLRQPL